MLLYSQLGRLQVLAVPAGLCSAHLRGRRRAAAFRPLEASKVYHLCALSTTDSLVTES